MRPVGILLPAVVISLTGGCATSKPIAVRATPEALMAAPRPLSVRLAEARGQFALGNVGLALESFRRASREQPDSLEALQGIADCYAQMGRFDLSRRYYEAALALAPHDVPTLTGLAASLAAEGLPAEATAVRSEVAAGTTGQAAGPLSARGLPDPDVTRPATSSSSVTVKLPDPRVAPVISPLPRAIATDDDDAPTPRGPHLERLSLGEVALVTRAGPTWRPQLVAASASRTTIRFVPLATRTASMSSVRLLNAARRQGLAARTRVFLADRGWRGMAIGNAPMIRATSLVLYPAQHASTARRLAAQFGCISRLRKGLREVILFLGRDSANTAPRRAVG